MNLSTRGGKRTAAEDRVGMLGAIRNPLVFFALALLIIEGIIGLVVTQSQMTGDQQFSCVLLMAGLFILVVASVVWITIKWPTHLYEDIIRVTEDVNALKSFVESAAFRDVVIDILEARVDESPSVRQVVLDVLQEHVSPELLKLPKGSGTVPPPTVAEKSRDETQEIDHEQAR